MVTPSMVPGELTKPWPQLEPASVTYGMLVNATSPTDELTAPPLRVLSPVQSCHAQNPPPGVLKPSGLVPCGDPMTSCALRLANALVLPKCDAAATATTPSWCPVAEAGDAAAVSAHIPANAPPVG